MVSVIINCFNGERYLREAIDSVYAQTYSDWEIVFLDNASTDGSAQIAKSYNNRLRYFRSEKTVSLGEARNLALEKANGEYIAFLDCDDVWLPEKLEKQVSILEDCLEADLLYSNYFLKKDNRKILAFLKQQPQGQVFERFLYHYPIGLLTAIIRKKALGGLDKLFDENLSLAEDFDLFLRLLYKSKAIYQHYPVAVYRVHSGMSTIKFMDRWLIEMEYIIKKFSSLYSDFEKNYSDALNKRRLDLRYLCAKIHMKQGDSLSARKQISPIKFLSLKYFLIYLFSYMPIRLWGFASKHFIRNPF